MSESEIQNVTVIKEPKELEAVHENVSPPRDRIVAMMMARLRASGVGDFHFDWENSTSDQAMELLDEEVSLILQKKSGLSFNQRRRCLEMHRQLNPDKYKAEETDIGGPICEKA